MLFYFPSTIRSGKVWSGQNAFPMAFFILLSILLTPAFALSQVQGTVFDADNYPLAGATVTWGDGTGTTVEVDGSFTLELVEGQHMVTVSYLGFASQTVHYDGSDKALTIILEELGTTLEDVTVTARDNGNSASVLKTFNVESISSKELRKAPCCSLAESFENSAVVDLTYGDPLTGRREIQMLGLRGNYTQLTLEKRPMLDGLASPYALDMIPGPWVQGIQIGKGSGSLESGAQGMTGEINTELIKPVNGPKLYLNAFAGSQGRGEINLVGNRQISENWYLGGAAHGSFVAHNQDFDEDGFLDMPKRKAGVGLLRLFKTGGSNWEGQWNVLGAYNRREGGQTDVTGGRANPYEINQDNKRLEVWGKTGYFGFNKPHQSLGTIYSASFHELSNVYGNQVHAGDQQSYYFNGLYQTRIGNDRHQLSMGGTARSDRFDEFLGEQDFSRDEMTVGAYGEYTFSWEEDRTGAPYRAFTAILGLRVDEHSLGGTQVSPRMNLKYNPSDQFAVRASAGRGWRSPNLLVDNINWLPSSRQVTLDRRDPGAAAGFIGLEKAWNYGTNLTGHVNVGKKQLEFVLDAYRTVFTDQIIVDAEQDFNTLRLYQLDGISRANSLLVSVNYEILPLIDVKLAYKYNDVRQTYRGGVLREVPLTPRHRYLATVGYDGPRFKAHLNYQFVGEQRLIDFNDLPGSVTVTQPQRAPGFGLVSAQLTYVANARTEIYFGGENLTVNRQANAIIGADRPLTGDYFDATQVYKPIFGAQAFLGVRYTVE